MTRYLAPESPQPSSVISESYFRQFKEFSLINYKKNQCLFGEEYEREFCFYLTKHIEVNYDDQVCLISDESKWIIPIQERLFLNKKISFIDCNFEQKLPTNKFDRIILLNCLHKINTISISSLRKSLTTNGRLVIIYREPSINTLPLPDKVIRKWFYEHVNHKKFIKQLYHNQNYNIEICQTIETIKFCINKFDWFNLLYHRMFYPLILIDQKQMIDELRQLNETYFKYHHGLVEIREQLTFLTVQKGIDNHFNIPKSIQTSKFEQQTLSITDEINQLLNLKKQKDKL